MRRTIMEILHCPSNFFGHDTPPSSPIEGGKEHRNFLDDGTLLKDCGEPDSAATGNDQEAHAAVDRELKEVLLSC